MVQRGAAREFINKIQRLRKSSNLNVEDDIVIFLLPGENSDHYLHNIGE